jgi:predicted enzyme related to lactoylglutathione lyase
MAGEFVHIEIPAADTQKSREFYGLLFGWKYQENPGPFDYYMAQIGDRQGAAITNMEPGMGHAPTSSSMTSTPEPRGSRN